LNRIVKASAPPIVLIVEDEPLIRMALADACRDAHLNVFEAASADEALEILRAHDVAALLTDIRLRGSMDGAVLARAMPTKMLVLVNSAHGCPTGIAEANFIAKPYDARAMALRVAITLAH
jgi:two-component system, response regulator PdtaR